MSVVELRKNAMMTHLLDSLEAGRDIAHCGRLVFAMVGRAVVPIGVRNRFTEVLQLQSLPSCMLA
jgi:hypothetical protein